MTPSYDRDLDRAPSGAVESARSAVAWGPVLAGAVVAIAVTMILLALGTGLGFAAASPWPGAGPAAKTFAVTAGIWLIVTQWLSSAMGGYIAGRLRTKWTGIHTHEVMFRDTAHGLLAWAVASLVIAAAALSATTSTVGAASTAATAAASDATDTLMRSSKPGAAMSPGARSDVLRLLSRGTVLQSNDRNYLTQEVATQTGVSQQEAQQRIDTAENSIRDAADKARKVSSALGFFTALSMLIGAFIASAAAAYAGQLRDERADLPS